MRAKAVCIIFLFLLVGCTNLDNEQQGVIAGGAVGGVLGNTVGSGTTRAVATAVGILIGSFVGGRIGSSIDRTDRMQVGRTLEGTRTGRSRRWRNPDTGARYTVTPTKTYTRSVNHSSQPCREFTTEANIGGTTEKIYGTACRMDDGSWKIVD